MNKRNTFLFLPILLMLLCCAGYYTPAGAVKTRFNPLLHGVIRMWSPDKMLQHPGFIVSVEYPGGKETKVPIDDIPTAHQFVFFKNGTEVKSNAQADLVIPIVRVEIYFADDPKRILEINEIGPDGQSLRRTYGAR